MDGNAVVRKTTSLSDEEVDRTIETFVSSLNIPAMSVAIFGPEGLRYRHTVGDIRPNQPFFIGSVSKPVTATLVLRLVDRGDIELEAPASRYVDLPLPEHIRVVDLLQHRSGLPQSAGYPGWADAPPRLADAIQNADIAAPPRAFEYCNLNYAILGKIVESVTEKAYAAALDEFVLTPLKMESTQAPADPSEVEHLVPGHQYVYGFPMQVSETGYLDYEIPAGFVAASATDLAQLGRMYLGSGRFDGQSFLKSSTVEKMLAPPDGDRGYAMGFSADRTQGLRLIRHEGLNRSYNSAVALLPEKDIGVVVLANVNNYGAKASEKMARNLALMAAGEPTEDLLNIEFVVRLAIGALVALFAILLLMNAAKWISRRFPTGFAKSGAWLRVGFAFVLMLALVIGLPTYFNTTVRGIMLAQPDLGFAFLLFAVGGFLNQILTELLKVPTEV